MKNVYVLVCVRTSQSLMATRVCTCRLCSKVVGSECALISTLQQGSYHEASEWSKVMFTNYGSPIYYSSQFHRRFYHVIRITTTRGNVGTCSIPQAFSASIEAREKYAKCCQCSDMALK